MIAKGRIERLRRGVSKWLVRVTPFRLLGGYKHPLKLELLGQGDGAWTIPTNVLGPTSICYCFGVGCDASFDVVLSKRYTCPVYSFDPTPSSIEYMSQHLDWPLVFKPWGIWSCDTTMALFHQDVSDVTNLSLINPGDFRGGKRADVELYSLKTIMQRLGHKKVALIKMDIEGAWFEVLQNMTESSIVPDVLCVEFDSPTSFLKVVKTIRLLRKAKLICIHRQRDDYMFVKEKFLAASGSPEVH